MKFKIEIEYYYGIGIALGLASAKDRFTIILPFVIIGIEKE